MLFIYRLLINLIIFFSPIIILIRYFKKKEDPTRFKEKFCFFSQKKKPGKLIWFHGASVGEILSVVPLIEKLEKNKNIKTILVTSNTLSSSKIIKNLGLKKTIHQFYPIDSLYLSKKFLNYWTPAIAVFIDSEIWPNMILNIKDKNIPLILLNARINKNSFKKWFKLSPYIKNIFNKFDLCLSSSKESKFHLKKLGAKNIKFFGNLKFSQTENNKEDLNKNLKTFLSKKKVWCAASTHNSEEKIAALAHLKLKKKNKNLITIIIPRHIDRIKIIYEELENLNLKVHLFSNKNIPDDETDIFLIDAYGKTKTFFKVCKIVFLGGSLIKHGGQNPLEAARYGCKILHGPFIWNFYEIYTLLSKNNLSNKIDNSNDMFAIIQKNLKKKINNQKIKFKINFIGRKVLDLTLKEINYFIIKK